MFIFIFVVFKFVIIFDLYYEYYFNEFLRVVIICIVCINELKFNMIYIRLYCRIIKE